MKRYKKDIEKRERMKNEKYKKSLNNKILFLLFFVYRKRYILQEKIVQENAVYAITFLVKFFLCVAAYLKRSNEIPTLMKLLWVSYFDLKYLAIN